MIVTEISLQGPFYSQILGHFILDYRSTGDGVRCLLDLGYLEEGEMLANA